jgi:hypothetical protein
VLQQHRAESCSRFASCRDRVRQATHGCGPPSHYARIKRVEAGGTHAKVHRDLTLSPTFPLIRSHRRSSGGKTPHHRLPRRHRPRDAGSHQIWYCSSTSSGVRCGSTTMSSTSTSTPALMMSSSMGKPSSETH